MLLEAQRLGPEVIIKMENVVWPFGASLPCLFAANARCTHHLLRGGG